MMMPKTERVGGSALILLVGMVLLALPASAQVDATTADLNGDGTVNILDISTMGSRFGLSGSANQVE